jgi:hypothetical protein
MSNEFQFVGTQLIIKIFYLICLLIIAFSVRNTFKKLFYFSLFTALTVFINILLSIPLPIQFDDTSLAYMTMNLLFVLVANYFKIMLLFYMPYEHSYLFLKVLKKPTVKYTVIGMFAFLISGVLLVASFANYLEKHNVFLLFISIDAIVSTIVLWIFSFFFFKSFSRINSISGLNYLLLFILVVSNTFFFVYYLKTFQLIRLPDSVWFRIIAFSFYIISLFFNAYYLASYASSCRTGKRLTILDTEKESEEVAKILGLQITILSNKLAITLTLEYKNGQTEKLTLEHLKATKPFGYWLHFAVAKKCNLTLTHAEISLIKFRMIEFWNKSMKTKIRQDLLFTNSRLHYDFQIEADKINLLFDETIFQKESIYQKIFVEFYRDFLPLLKSLDIKITHKKDVNTISKSFKAVIDALR